MRHRYALILVTACALVVALLSVSVAGCSMSMPWASTSPKPDTTAVVDQAIDQLQAALGLSEGAVTKSSQQPLLVSTDVPLHWIGGRADVDVKSGHIRSILVADAVTIDITTTGSTDDTTGVGTTASSAAGSSSATLSSTELESEAARILGLLGWDAAALETAGYTPDASHSVDYPSVGTIYEKTWLGHDPRGVPNQGVVQVGIQASDGALHSFLCSPGPDTSLDLAKTISEAAALKTAAEAASKSPFLILSTTTTAPSAMAPSTTAAASSTTTTARSRKKVTTTTTAASTTTTTAATSTTTTVKDGVQSVTLIHTDDPGITGGEDLLVWEVKLAPDPSTGRGSAVVYVDAVKNTALLVLAD